MSYDILIRTQLYGVPPDVVAKEYGVSRNAINNRNLRSKAWMEEKLKKIRRQT